jgi:hypothetical protein
MRFDDYVAWLEIPGRGRTSVAVGTRKAVEKKARETFATANWQEWEGPEATLRITKGARQLFAAAYQLKA